MKKRNFGIGLLCLMLTFSLMGCVQKTSDAELPSTEAAEETQVETAAEETEAEEEEEEATGFTELEMPEYDASEYVQLGEYKKMTIDIVKSEVDDETLEMELENEMYDYSQETEITKGASDEDYVSLTLTLTVDGEEIYAEEEEYSILLGFNEFGEDVDQALMGAKAKDHIEVDSVLDDMYGDEYVDKTGHYSIDVIQVYRYEVPELNKEFVKENTEYNSVKEFKEARREALQAEEDHSNHYEAEELAIQLATEGSTFKGYPEELYNYCYDAMVQTYTWYAEMFGMELEDIISDEELEAAVMNEVYSNMTVSAIVQAEGLELTDEAYETYLVENMSDFGCESVEEMKEYYADYELRNYATRSLVGTYLMEQGTLNEMSRADYDAIYNAEEE